jgi:perosamine synthetase
MGDMRRLLKLCKKYNFKLIEDAAEALGSFYDKKHAGTFGDVGILSFNGNKTITTGSGGAILLKNKKDKKKAEKLINISKVKKKNYVTFDDIGYNYKISNIQSALGLAQMESLKKIIKKKRKLNLNYKKEFQNCDYAKILETEKNCSSNYWINLLVLEDNYIDKRHQIEKKMSHYNIEIRSSWDLMHRLPHFSSNPKMKLNISTKMNRKILYLPSSPKYA